MGGGEMKVNIDEADSIEKHKEAEETKLLLASIVESSDDAIFSKTREGIILSWNEGAKNLYGYSKEEIIGSSITILIPIKRRHEIKKILKMIKKGDKLKNFETITLKKDGSPVNVSITISPVKDIFGKIIAFSTIARDITEQKKAEIALRYRLVIEELVSTLSSHFISLTGGEIDMDITNSLQITGKFIGADCCFINLYSRDLKEIKNSYGWCNRRIKARSEDLKDISLETCPWLAKKIKSFENIYISSINNLPPDAEWEKEFWRDKGLKSLLAIPMALGKSMIGLFGFSFMRSERNWSGEDVRLLKLVADIFVNVFERKRIEEESKKIDEHLRQVQKLESLGVMAGGIAHDFNNILTGIMGFAEITMMTLPKGSPVKDYVKEIIKSASKAGELTKQMLAYSGMGQFDLKSINLSIIVKDMSQLLDITITNRCHLKYHLKETLPLIEGDSTQISQITMNLIINASEAIKERGGTITVSTGTRECSQEYFSESYLSENLSEGLYVYLEIKDTGCGMTQEVQDRIFDPFFTTKFTGRGLGMAAVLGMVRAHQGAIKVYSKPGIGTTVKVLFPAIEASMEDVNKKAKKDEKGTILIIDDEKNVRKIGKIMLERAGYNTLTASGGKEGVNIFLQAKKKEITAVILDMKMPDMNGKETFRELKAIDKDIKIILTTGYNEEDIDCFRKNELAGFIPKPFRVKELIETVKNVIEG